MSTTVRLALASLVVAGGMAWLLLSPAPKPPPEPSERAEVAAPAPAPTPPAGTAGTAGTSAPAQPTSPPVAAAPAKPGSNGMAGPVNGSGGTPTPAQIAAMRANAKQSVAKLLEVHINSLEDEARAAINAGDPAAAQEKRARADRLRGDRARMLAERDAALKEQQRLENGGAP